MSSPEVLDRIVARMHEGASFLISSHVRLDGDGIASALAVDGILRALGKKSLILVHGHIPEVYLFLPGIERVVSLADAPDATAPDDLDTFFIVDVADEARLGDVSARVPEGTFTVSIDHHATGDIHADVDYCDGGASSTGELVWRLAERGGFEVTREVAACIYTAIVTDTQRFTLPNTSASALRAAADMVERGADPGLIGDRIYRSQKPGQLALWADVASRLRIDMGGRLAWTSLTDAMLEKHGVHPDDTQDLTDVARTLSGVEVGVLFRERPGNLGVRVSFRSNHVPVLPVAERFGGGGHKLACGCELAGTLGEVEPKVLDAVRALLAEADAK